MIKQWLLVRFANSVPEYDGQFYATEKEAKAAVMERFDYDQRPLYIFELKYTAKIGLQWADMPNEWSELPCVTE